MSKDLYRELAVRMLLFFPMMGALMFIPAGTLRYWEAWVFGAVFLVCNLVLTAYLAIVDPKLLARRMRVGPAAETSVTQKILMTFGFLFFAAAVALPGLDHRFGWSEVPASVVLLGDALVVLAFIGLYRVFKENTFGASTIQVEADQRVVSTGPYAIVRHPMYSAVLVLLAGMPLALGSWWGLLVTLLGVPMIAWRLLDEEQFLRAQLRGYSEYTRTVRWRLVPGVF